MHRTLRHFAALFPLALFSLAAGLPVTSLAQVQAQTQAPQPRRPMTFEDLQKMRRLGDLAISPNSKWVLFAVTDADLQKNTKTSHLWVVPAAGGAEEKPVTSSQAGESRGRFSPDGKTVYFVSARDGKPQVYAADFDDASGNLGMARQITHAVMGADGVLPSPDGTALLYTSSVYPDCAAGPRTITGPETAGGQEACNRERAEAEAASKVKAQIFTHLLYRHWNAFTGDTRSHLFLQRLENGAAAGAARDLNAGDTHDVPPFAVGGPDAYAFSPDGKEVAFEENLDPEPAISTHVDVWTLRLDDGGARPVKVSTSAGGNFSPAYSPDGKYIAWRSQARNGYESDQFRLVAYDRAAKQLREVLPKFDRWVDEFCWGADSQTIFFAFGDVGEERLDSVHVDGSELAKVARLGEFGDLHASADGKLLLTSRMTVRMPSEVVALKLDQPVNIGPERQTGAKALPGTADAGTYRIATERQLTRLNGELLAQLDLQEMEHFWFTGGARARVEGFIVRPPGFDPAKKYPLKFLIHGGPQGAWGNSWSYRWNPELLAANGYVVVMVNARGSTGYGQAFTDGVNGDWGGKPYLDLMRGLDAAEARYPFIDKGRECALGASYGGYMVNWMLGHTDRFKCMVSHDGMFNPESAYGSTEELWFNEWEFKGTPWNNRLGYRRWSPMLFAPRFKTPTLVVHSQLDYRLDVSEGMQLFTTLQRLKVPSKMLYFPDEGHWVLKPQNSALWYKTVNDWCDQWTGTASTPKVNDQGATGLRTQQPR